MSLKKPVYVTQPSLAPLEEFTRILESAWDNGILTHNGPLVQKLEKSVAKKLQTPNFIAVTNGTVALQMAIKALALKGEIIISSFTWIATVSAVKWEGCEPICCDIDPETLNINPKAIESLITKDTVAIMPVHVFGNACDVEEIQKLADKHGLHVIYDAAHAIGSTYMGKSLLNYGDISATSLHATKLLNTAEGGACITKNEELAEKLRRIRFFGFDQNKMVVEDGFNGKMTEVHAALGLANLKYFDKVLTDRNQKYQFYLQNLDLPGKLSFQKLQEKAESNFSYFPVIFNSEDELLSVLEALENEKIYARRYFYPSVNTFNDVVRYRDTPIAEDISKRILCLPLYLDLQIDEMQLIVGVIKRTIN